MPKEEGGKPKSKWEHQEAESGRRHFSVVGKHTSGYLMEPTKSITLVAVDRLKRSVDDVDDIVGRCISFGTEEWVTSTEA